MRRSAEHTRKTLLWTIIMIAVIAALTWAVAQVLPPDDLDPGKPSTWFVSAAGWGFMVMFAVNFLKTNILNIHGFGTVAVAAVLAFGGTLLAGTGILEGAGIYLEGTVAELISFGLTAFVSSAGSWDTIKRLNALRPSVTAVVDVSHAPSAVKAAEEAVAKERAKERSR